MRRDLLALILLLPAALHASFEDYLTGGRATGVDGAMTAMTDDAFALYYNPAAAAFFSGPEIGMDAGRLYSGLTDNSSISRSFLGYAYPFHRQALGVSYTALSLGGLYKEEMIGLSYAWKMGDHFAVGVTGKNYRKSIGHDFNTDNAELDGNARLGVSDPVFQNGYDADAWGGDASMLWRLENGWRTGLMVRNVNEPNVALGSGADDPATRSWNWGIGREWNGHAVMVDATRERFTEMETRLHGGYETWWPNGLGMRAGGGYGARDYRRITAGFSYRLSLIQFDYGYMMPFDTVDGTVGTHQLSLSFHFGRPAPAPAPVLRPVYSPPPTLDLNELLGESFPTPEKSDEPLPEKETMDITITPSYAFLQAGGEQQFQAQVAGSSEARVFWTIMPPLGAVSPTGLYRAPAEIFFAQNVWVTAKSETARHRLRYERVMVRLKPSTADSSLEMRMNLDFDGGGVADLKSEDDAEIERVAVLLEQYPQTTAVIESHTDNQGSPARSRSLSERQAEAVRGRLIHRFGIAPERLTARGFGDSLPLASNETAEGRRRNRRLIAVISAPAAPPEAPAE
jgi:outer membrane protein OmpA-like peptidoglycan-associated protein